jgi:phosphomannomutase
MLKDDVLIGGEESGGISFKGHIPEGDGILMGLLLTEIVAAAGKSLHELVSNLLKDVGPAFYTRSDLRLQYPVAKARMTQELTEKSPVQIGQLKVSEVSTIDGVKYILEDDSWLLIRPSGTEPVLRVYSEGRNPEIVQAMLDYGEEIAARFT